MARRADLQILLESILGSRNVYYDPPESVRMNYPAIRYKLSKINNTFANNSVYKQNTRYEIILMHDDPDSELVGVISRLPMCTHDRSYIVDNLHHDVFTLYI